MAIEPKLDQVLVNQQLGLTLLHQIYDLVTAVQTVVSTLATQASLDALRTSMEAQFAQVQKKLDELLAVLEGPPASPAVALKQSFSRIK